MMYFHFVGREPDHVLCQTLCISIPVLYIWSRLVGRPLSGLVRSFQCICIQYIWLYIHSLYLAIYLHCVPYSCSVITLFPLYIHSLSIISVSAWLVTTGTVKRAYGQWLVYGEFNTLGFISSPRLTYKFQGHYSWYQSSRFYSSRVQSMFGYGVILGSLLFDKKS